MKEKIKFLSEELKKHDIWSGPDSYLDPEQEEYLLSIGRGIGLPSLFLMSDLGLTFWVAKAHSTPRICYINLNNMEQTVQRILLGFESPRDSREDFKSWRQQHAEVLGPNV